MQAVREDDLGGMWRPRGAGPRTPPARRAMHLRVDRDQFARHAGVPLVAAPARTLNRKM